MADHQTIHAVFGFAAVDVQGNLFTHHHFGQLGFVGLTGVDGADIFTFAQDRHAVRKGKNLVELVGDDNDGLAVVAHTAQDGEELLGLLRSQNDEIKRR